MSDNTIPERKPEQQAAIEAYRQKTGIDPTPIINLVERMRADPRVEEALSRALANLKPEQPESNQPPQ